MLTGDIRNQIDRIWDAFWAGGIANPIEVIEQLTYLLFLKRLDEVETAAENKARMLGQPMERRIFPPGNDAEGELYAGFRWKTFREMEARRMYTVLAEHVFPFLRALGTEDSTYARHVRGARFAIPEDKAGLLVKVVDLLDRLPMEDRDTKGDVYEYMLSKLSISGQNGQFRTPRHIIQLMVELRAPQPMDLLCDPAAGTCGFLVAAGEYLREHHAGRLADPGRNRHFHQEPGRAAAWSARGEHGGQAVRPADAAHAAGPGAGREKLCCVA